MRQMRNLNSSEIHLKFKVFDFGTKQVKILILNEKVVGFQSIKKSQTNTLRARYPSSQSVIDAAIKIAVVAVVAHWSSM